MKKSQRVAMAITVGLALALSTVSCASTYKPSGFLDGGRSDI